MNGKSRWPDVAIALSVFVFVFLLYVRTVGFEFINMDDPYYVVGHDVVAQGLGLEGIRYAFTSTSEGNYLPLTWLSHMAVVEVGGTGPAAHHLANVLLHALNASLLYLFIRTATGSAGRALAVALLWAAHPLRVESVAWVAERKDVLSGTFFILGLMAYAVYARRPGFLRYGAVFVLLALGLLAKSILMTLPCVFLLLDFWPLRRIQLLNPGAVRQLVRLIAEKIPLLMLSVGAGLLAIWSQGNIGALNSVETLPVSYRIWNALSSCATYLLQLVWPVNLSIYYPYRSSQELYLWGGLGLCAIVLISLAAALGYRSRPYVAVGWLWFLSTVAPVIGLLQAGAQAHADRYTYLPHIGLLVAIVWTAADQMERWPRTVPWRAAIVGVLVLISAMLTWRQSAYWRSSETVFAHALAVTGPNRFAEGNYGDALLNLGRPEEAEKHFIRALEIGPATYQDYHNLGATYLVTNRLEEARELFDEALRRKPDYRLSWVLLGDTNLKLAKPQEAIDAYREAERLGETSARFHTNVGIALGMAARRTEAEAEFKQALALSADYVPALYNLGVLAVERNEAQDAQHFFNRVLTLEPEHEGAREALSMLNSPSP